MVKVVNKEYISQFLIRELRDVSNWGWVIIYSKYAHVAMQKLYVNSWLIYYQSEIC